MTTPDNGKYLTKSLNPTLNYLLGSRSYNLFIPVVDPGGDGHYTTIKDAVDDGYKVIRLKTGTHPITANLELDNVSLLGEHPFLTIVELSDGVSITMKEPPNSTTAGTWDPTNNTTTQTGTGTSWNSVDEDYPHIIGEYRHLNKISSISNNTTFILPYKFQGPTNTLATNQWNWAHVTTDVKNIGCILENFTLKSNNSAPTIALNVSGVHNNFRNIIFDCTDNNTTHVFSANGTNKVFFGNVFENCIFRGGSTHVSLQYATENKIENCFFDGPNTNCILLGAFSFQNKISNSTFQNSPSSTGDSILLDGNVNVQHNQISNCSFLYGGTGVYLENGSDHFTVISNCIFYRQYRAGVEAVGVCSVSNCSFDDCEIGVYMRGAEETVVACHFHWCRDSIVVLTPGKAVIDGNIFWGDNTNHYDDSIDRGIRLFAGEDISVTNNKFYDFELYFILVDSTIKDLNITGNTFNKSNAQGIGIDTATSTRINISNNTFKDVADDCISCLAAVDYLNISGNIFSDTDECINLDSVTEFNINNNLIAGNNLSEGILINDCTEGNINNNIIKSTNSNSISITGTSANITINSNKIQSSGARGINTSSTNNRLNICSNNITSCTNEGIHMDADNCVISGNICHSNDVGINISSSADRTILTSNHCLSNVSNQIVNNGTNSSVNNNIVT